MKSTPARRAIRWARDHGRPMDSTVILAWEAGWNSACRFRDGWAKSMATPTEFELTQQLIQRTRERDSLRDELRIARAALAKATP